MDWTIRQTTEATGLSADTLRYYEKEGIISPKRRENGYRYYDENDIAVLKNIIVMKYARFTLTEMKYMEELYTSETGSECNKIAKRILTAKITELKQTIVNYRKIIAMMEALLPMVDSSDSYRGSEIKIDEYLNQVFNDIRRGMKLSQDTKKREGKNR